MKNVIISCLLVIYYIVFKHIFIKDKIETCTLEKWICTCLPTAVLTSVKLNSRLSTVYRTLKFAILLRNSGNHKDIINKLISSVILLCFYFDGRTATQTFCTSQDAHMNLSMKAVDGLDMIRSNEHRMKKW